MGAENYCMAPEGRTTTRRLLITSAMLLGLMSTAMAEAAHGITANPHENFTKTCDADHSVVHLVVSGGQLDPSKIEIKSNHKTYDRAQQYPQDRNSFKLANNTYIWSGMDNHQHAAKGTLTKYAPVDGSEWHYREIVDDRVIVDTVCN
jgi:hypothetical protein